MAVRAGGPEAYLAAVTAAGADPAHMDCVRNVFERTGEGSLPEAAATFDAVERITGRPATSLRAFLRRHREHFAARPRPDRGPFA
ncbi:hypothetical protein ACRAKI_17605 [Saccharothrix isguenensis]